VGCYSWYSEEGPGRPPINASVGYQLHIIRCGTIIASALLMVNLYVQLSHVLSQYLYSALQLCLPERDSSSADEHKVRKTSFGVAVAYTKVKPMCIKRISRWTDFVRRQCDRRTQQPSCVRRSDYKEIDEKFPQHVALAWQAGNASITQYQRTLTDQCGAAMV